MKLSVLSVLFGLIMCHAAGAQCSFEVASIKPSALRARQPAYAKYSPDLMILNGVSIKTVMIMALPERLHDFQIEGGPSWFYTDRYNISGRYDRPLQKSMTPAQKQAAMKEWRECVWSLLEDRCRLQIHHETKQMAVYALTIEKHGIKFSHSQSTSSAKFPVTLESGLIDAHRMSMYNLSAALTNELGTEVTDKTGLPGFYDIKLSWQPEQRGIDPLLAKEEGGEFPAQANVGGPSIFTAIQEQLGLKLKPEKGPVDIIVIDHVERPSPD